MKTIIKNRSNLDFLNKPIETLSRDALPRQLTRNMEALRVYRDVMKMT